MAIALGTAFARLNAGSSSVKRMFKGSVGIWNADAADWIRRVQANDGAVSTATANAVTNFCNAIDAAGIRDRFYRLNLFCGTGLNACLVPLYRGASLGGTQYGNAVDQSLGSPSFGHEDYAETGASGGLVGNGSSKYLNTGFNADQLPAAANCHLSAYIRGTQSVSTAMGVIGAIFNGVTDRYRIGFGASTAGNFTTISELGKSTQIIAVRANTDDGLYTLSRTSTTSLTHYNDASSFGTNTASTAEATGAFPIYVFCRNSTTNAPVEFYNGVMAGYSIGSGLTADDVSAYYTALQAFQTALGRNV